MGIKRKQAGPKPNASVFPLEWQNIAFDGRPIAAIRTYRATYPLASLTDASRAVKAFIKKHNVVVKHESR